MHKAGPPDRAGAPVTLELSHPRCTDSSYTCEPVALLARAADLLPVLPTLVLVGSLACWPVRGQPRTGRCLAGAVTIRGWLARGYGTTAALGPVLYNVVPAAVDDLLVELGGLGERVADADPTARLVVSLQSFAAADVSATVTIAGPDQPVRVSSRWGLPDELGPAGVADTLVLSRPGLAVLEHEVMRKATAVVAADAGTRLLDVPAPLQRRATVTVEEARSIARSCAVLVQRWQRGAQFEIAASPDAWCLLACRPLGPAPPAPAANMDITARW